LTLARKGLFAVFLFLFGFSIRLSAQIGEQEEMIYHLFQFVDWNQTAVASNDFFLICNGKKIKVFNFFDLKKDDTFDLVYLSENEVDKSEEVITFCNEHKILSVSSNNPSFCKKGGIVNFAYKRLVCDIQINNKMALLNRIYFSPQLLNIAEIIGY